MDEPRPWRAANAARSLNPPTAASDKYSRGVVALRTGTERYPGAAVLSVEGAWRAGPGLVRYAGPATAEVIARRPETVVGSGRAHAWVIGSGTDAADRTPTERRALEEILAGGAPVVIDAGALDLARSGTAPRILTPHTGEFERLGEEHGFHAPRTTDAATRLRGTIRLARELQAVVVLKGAQTLVVDSEGFAARVISGTPWLATAGTGDVLSGIMGALIASARGAASTSVLGGSSSVPLARLAATAVWIHGAAARLAAGQLGKSSAPRLSLADSGGGPGGRPIVAVDVAAAVPRIIGSLLHG